MWSDDRVVVEQVDFVVAGPRPSQPELVHRRDPLDEQWPVDVFEQVAVRLEVVVCVVVVSGFGLDAADEPVAFWPHPDPGGVEEHRKAVSWHRRTGS